MIILCQFTRMVEAIKKSLEHFGYKNIRPNQEQVVRNYLEGKDVLFCSPTGSGISLTFELASFVFKCLSTDQSAPASVIVVFFFWHDTTSCTCSLYLYCMCKVSESFCKSSGTS